MAAGFEVVVRPVVFPSIRPVARVFVPEDAPDKGIAVIGGSGGKLIDLPHSSSVSSSKSRMVEVKRVYDIARVYYTTKYWEFEVLKSLEFLVNGQSTIGQQFGAFMPGSNVQIINRGLTRVSSGS